MTTKEAKAATALNIATNILADFVREHGSKDGGARFIRAMTRRGWREVALLTVASVGVANGVDVTAIVEAA